MVEYIVLLRGSKRYDPIELCKRAVRIGRDLPQKAKVEWKIIPVKDFDKLYKEAKAGRKVLKTNDLARLTRKRL